jgi:drug/metabolite transporter (DMT)-like permease
VTGTLVGLVAAVAAAGLFGVAAVLQAHGVRSEDRPMDSLREFVGTAVRNRYIMAVVAAYLAGFVLHAVSIWYLPLYLAQSAVALSLPVTALSASRLRERLGLADWLAVVGIVAGLVLVSLGSGAPGESRSSATFALVLWLGVALLLAFGFRGRSLGAGTLGAVAGLGYAGSAIAVRGVALPPDPWVAAAAAAVPASSPSGSTPWRSAARRWRPRPRRWWSARRWCRPSSASGSSATPSATGGPAPPPSSSGWPPPSSARSCSAGPRPASSSSRPSPRRRSRSSDASLLG